MEEEIHCFNKTCFRPLDHGVHLTKEHNKNTIEDVTLQSLISHTLWL